MSQKFFLTLNQNYDQKVIGIWTLINHFRNGLWMFFTPANRVKNLFSKLYIDLESA